MAIKAYAQAGVNIDLKESLLRQLKPDFRKASRPEVVGGIGAFGGLFDISRLPQRKPVLVSSTDSVGTKLKVALLAGDHRYVGFDIVHHCLNDIGVMGAAPLFFLDYFASDQLRPEVFTTVLRSVAKACQAARCALVGGETAELPGVYQAGEYDLVGCIVGVVEKKHILSGEAIRPGDALIGVQSNGLHTNGYSLARRILFDQGKMKPQDKLPGTRQTIGAALLKPHVNYSPLLLDLLAQSNRGKDFRKRQNNDIFGAAHITGGGFTGNINRILPPDSDALIRTQSWQVPPLFAYLRRQGAVDFAEAYEVWNMGVGLVLVVRPSALAGLHTAIAESGLQAWTIGEIIPGTGRVLMEE